MKWNDISPCLRSGVDVLPPTIPFRMVVVCLLTILAFTPCKFSFFLSFYFLNGFIYLDPLLSYLTVALYVFYNLALNAPLHIHLKTNVLHGPFLCRGRRKALQQINTFYFAMSSSTIIP